MNALKTKQRYQQEHKPVLDSPFLNGEQNRTINNILYHYFLQPLFRIPTHTAYVDPKFPFVYYFSLTDYYKHSTNPKYLQVKIPTRKDQVAHIDVKSPVTPWHYSFQMDKRRAARWLRTPEDILTQYFKFLQVDAKHWLKLLDYPLSICLPLFKAIKTYIHTHYDQLGLAARYFVDIDSISGIPPNSLRTQSDDPYKWLTQSVKTEYTQAWWKQQFFTTFCDCAVRTPLEVLSFSDFVKARWLWVTEGASKFSKLYLDQTYVRTKFGAAVSLTDAELMGLVQNALHGTRDQQIGVFIKSDEASYKNRLIANVPLGGYLIAAYIRYLIESYCTAKPKFAKLMPTFGDKINIIDMIRSGYQIYPLDESAYDYHVTRESWLGFIDFMKEAFPNNRGVQYFEVLFNNTSWIFNDKQGKWLKGMPSGLALTSLLNSWMNYIKQLTIVPGHLNWACGDDVLAVPFDQDLTLQQIEEQYNKFGSETNAAKNWTSYRFGEYLRVLYSRNGTTGYPARIWGTLLFAYDMSFRAPIDRLNENTSIWKLLFDRLGLPMDEDMVVRDLVWAMWKVEVFYLGQPKKFNKQIAKLWLHAFRVNGGYGKVPNNQLAFNWQFSEKKVAEYINSRIRLPRVVSSWGNVKLIITPQPLKTDVALYYGEPYSLPPIETEEEWIARLNREDLPDKGPFTSLVLDPIPLPVMDFVSIANMSQIAQQYGFNAYPNLHGSWITINSRLCLQSLKLVDHVTELKQQHNISVLA